MDVTTGLPQLLILDCPNCSAKIDVTTHAQCISVVCHSCLTSSAFLNGSLINSGKKLTPFLAKPYIPLASIGTINGRKYKLVGVMEKCENGTGYFWREYMLFNPYYGYAFLSEYKGHWVFLEQLIVHPKKVVINTDLAFDRQWFKIYNKYQSKLVAAAGEFCFDINDGENESIREWISPPNILSYESTHDEMAWFSGKHISASDVKSAFNLKDSPPTQVGIGAVQPMKASIDFDSLLKVTGLLLVFLVFLQIILATTGKDKIVVQESYNFQLDTLGGEMPLISRSFQVDGPTNLQLKFYSPVSNSWIEFNNDLVNETTGEHFMFGSVVEYYTGYEGGSSWSEGSQREKELVSKIPSGTYHVNIFPAREFTHTASYFELTVTEGVQMYSNTALLAAAFLIFPLITYWRRNAFERKRWYNSDYSPYDE